MNEEQLTRVMNHLAESQVPAGVDLWPAIREQLKTSKKLSSKGDLLMDTKLARSRRLRLASALLIALMVAGVLLFATPQGRALAQEFLQFFNRTGSDSFPAPAEVPLTWVERFEAPPPTPAPLSAPFASDCGIYLTPTCSLEQIRSKVAFTVKELGTVPDSVNFIGATGGPDHVYVLYDTGGQHGFLVLWESLSSWSKEHRFQVGASAVVETVQIGSSTGEYVRGSFGYMAGDPTVIWDANADTQTLVWVDNGVTMEMQSAGAAFPFDRDQFVALAETLTTGAVAVRPTPSAPAFTLTPTLDAVAMFNSFYPLTLIEARDQAGFEPVTPGKLPQILFFQGAAYDRDLQIIRIFYLLNQTAWGPNTNGLLLKEMRIPNAFECGICSFVKGDIKPFDGDPYDKIVPSFTSVQIGNITAEYTAGNWENYNKEKGSWTWEPRPYMKRMRWQANGMAYELTYWGMELNQDDLITIAKSLK